jgi:basic membrane lipoprotein Med (substrate-binding protein (PBP1-ABC) superfamily)
MMFLARGKAKVGLVVAAGVALLAGVVVWLLWPSPPEPRARKFLELTACVLTDERGISGPEAAQVWAGLDEASKETHAQTEYMAVTGERTLENARAYVNGLAVGHCDLLFAVGELQVRAVEDTAEHFPSVRFYTVGAVAARGVAASGNVNMNVTRVDGEPRSTVRQIVINAVARETP